MNSLLISSSKAQISGGRDQSGSDYSFHYFFRYGCSSCRVVASIIVIGLVLVLSGCQTINRNHFDRIAAGMQVEIVDTGLHQHLMVTRVAQGSTESLNVYIEGDGRPWIKRFFVAEDPTPRYPLALDLMRQDPNNVLYLGRPCYFNNALYGLRDNRCNSSLWTSARYSDAVIGSMSLALEQYLDKGNYSEVTLIGHSGGGTLAVLIADRTPQVDRVVTVAANLDIEAWTRHHRFSPLNLSVNPATTEFARELEQHHFAGGNDEVVPPALNVRFEENSHHQLHIIDRFDHVCCWVDLWPELLELIGLAPVAPEN